MVSNEQQLSGCALSKGEPGTPRADASSDNPVLAGAVGFDVSSLDPRPVAEGGAPLASAKGEFDSVQQDPDHLLAPTMLAAHAEHVRGA